MITSETGYPRPLTARQRLVLTEIARYFWANGEPCTVAYLARRFDLSPTTVRRHLEALHDKGWLPAPCAPHPPVTDPSEPTRLGEKVPRSNFERSPRGPSRPTVSLAI